MSQERDLPTLVRELEQLEAVIATWNPPQQSTVQALRTTLEQIQAGAFRELIRAVKEEPGGLEALSKAVESEWVHNVLVYHGLLRAPAQAPSLRERIEAALDSVRPTLLGHSGDVEIVSIEPPELKIKLLGTCDGCVFSGATVKNGIEAAVLEAAPEIERVVVDKQGGARGDHFGGSPFARPWHDVGPVESIPDDGVIAVELEEASVLLTRVWGEVRAFPNACPHLGMPLDTGEVKAGVLTCQYHGFEFLLVSGECLTAPEVQLPRYPVRIKDGHVQVQVTA